MRVSSAICLTSLALTASATEGVIGYNALFGRAESCLTITTGANETVSDPSTRFIGTTSTSAAASSTTPAPAPATPTPPYAQGMCSLHMTQWDSMADATANNGLNDGIYGCEVRILDNNQQTIGWQVHTDCSSAQSLSVNSKLEDPIVITPEAQGDYVQFTAGRDGWPSSQQGPTDPSCRVGGWDGSDDPAVSSPARRPRM